ncbi:MAG: hypothetical protein ACLP3R_25140 [Candidatus Korobacteraceae bacterium]|jgi:tetrahydromethanopterin S-methyltransferase subunit E
MRIPSTETLRPYLAIVAGILGAYIGFKVFRIAYVDWAVWRYPHNNSMAGFAAFMYGIPVGAISGVIGFCLVFFYGKVGPWPENRVGPSTEE